MLGRQAEVGTVAAGTAVVVQTLLPGLAGRRAHEEEQYGKGVVVGDLRTQRPGYGLRLIASQSYGSALPRMINNRQRDLSTSKGRGDTRGIDPRGGSTVCRPMISGRLSSVAEGDSLDAGGRASWNIFLLWLFENARCAVDLASTTWRLGPGRGGTVSGSLSRQGQSRQSVPRLHNGSSPYDRRCRPVHRASECALVGAILEQCCAEPPLGRGSCRAG